MKKLIIYSFFLLIAIVLLNCNSGRKSERIAQLDSLHNFLDTVQTMLKNDINYDSVTTYYNKLKIYQEKIAPFLKKMDEKEKSDFFQLLSTEKQFKIFIGNYEGYKDELEYSKNQINTLRKDVEENNLNSKQFDEYYNAENKAIVILFHSVKMDTYKTLRNIEKFTEFESKVLMLIDKYQEKKK